MGSSELLVLAIVVVLVIIPAYLPFYFRKKQPDKLWLGIVLSFVSGTAQFYIPEKAVRYFLLCAVFFLLMRKLLTATWMAGLSTDVFQAGVLYYRFLKLRGPHVLKARV